ncbi:MAG: DUF6356 family protein [Sphingomicrobium sp.]|jgi:hypothetical protein
MLRESREHLAGVDETYFEHMSFALVVGMLTLGAGLACVLHAFVPALCPNTCSRTVGLLQNLFEDRRKLPIIVAESSGVLVFVTLVMISCITAVVVGFCTATSAIGLVVIPQAFALPLIFLAQNRKLEPLPA